MVEAHQRAREFNDAEFIIRGETKGAVLEETLNEAVSILDL
jgi:hypothetical protein